MVDYYSRYIEIAHLTNMTSGQTIGKTKNMFAHWGIPDEVVTDNGTQFFSDEFRVFAETYGFGHTTSSPYFPQSNGEVETAVQTAKKILKQDDRFLALMAYRATPVQPIQTSPCQLIMGRQIRTRIPTLEKNLLPSGPPKRKYSKVTSAQKHIIVSTTTGVMEHDVSQNYNREMKSSSNATMKNNGGDVESW